MNRTAKYGALAGLWISTAFASVAAASPSANDATSAAASVAPDPTEAAQTTEPVVADESRCVVFKTQEEAQAAFVKVGGPSQDLYGLDGDRNGKACESLPAATVAPTVPSTAAATAAPTVAAQPVYAAPVSAPAPQVVSTPKPAPVQPSNCDPSYSGCLDPNAADYDCEGGSGNGPKYTGPVEVRGDDHYDLDADNDGFGCEASG
jgi:hypothetical protein